MPSIGRLPALLASASAGHRGIVMGFLPAGFPDVAAFGTTARDAFAAGLDVLEVSLPGQVPDLDGPTIARAASISSPQFGGFADALDLAAHSRNAPGNPIVVLAYPHHVARIGVPALAAAVAEADLDGLLLPGTAIDDQLQAAAIIRDHRVEPVLFVHLHEELAALAALDESHTLRRDPPLIYLQSADMHTGAAFNADKAIERLAEMRAGLAGFGYRVVVGFGIRGADDVAAVVEHGADGAVIGTALVEAAERGPREVRALIEAVRPALAHIDGRRAS